jgi:tRNA A37 threonylcarbamoyltransferase TsaD
MGGGVTANLLLRERMLIAADGLPVIVPSPSLSVDNGAMIAAAAYFENVPLSPDRLDLDIVPSLSIA